MRLTANGRILLGLLLLTLLSALASGNNLLYLLLSLLAAALLLSAPLQRLNLRGLAITARFPDIVFRGVPFPLEVRVRNASAAPAYFVRLSWGDDRCFLGRLDPGEERVAVLTTSLPHRGRNRLDGAVLESAFPFGLLTRPIPLSLAEGLAFPRPREVRSARELDADAAESGAPRPRKGAGDELFGLREHAPGDDARLINWKLSARTGKLLVNEHSVPGGTRITVRLETLGAGEAGEARICEAASACKHFIDAGAEVRLCAPGVEIGYGKGLLQLDRLLRALALLGDGRRLRPASGPRRALEPSAAPAAPILRETALGCLLVYASLFLIDEIDPALLAAGSLVFPLALWMERGGRRLPAPLWTGASLLVLAYVLFFGWHLSGITLANTHLLFYILVHRLLTPKGDKELRQIFLILFLAFFLISGQTISLWYFGAFVFYALFAARWLILDARSAGPEARREHALRPAGFSPATATLLAAGVLAMTGVAFAATPRLEPLRRMNPFVAMGLDKRHPRAEFVVSFTEQVSLGWFGRLKRSSARVLRVKPVLGFALPEPGAAAPILRVRGAALDAFDGRRWSKDKLDIRYRVDGADYYSLEGRAWAPRRGRDLVLPGKRIGKTVFEYTLHPLNTSVLFTVDGSARVEVDGNAVYFDHTDTVYFGAPYLGGLNYRVYASERPTQVFSAHVAGYAGLLNERFLQLPELDERIPELARSLTAGRDDPRAKIQAVVAHFQRGYAHTLYADEAGGGLARFLFDARRGNCEYFATAAAVLLRAAGVPTRLVTGFLADDWNEYGKFYDVRQGQAHAWVEAFVGGPEGWVTVDATPAGTSGPGRRDGALERLTRMFDAVQLRWYRYIIGYDQFVQRNTFLRLRITLKTETVQSLVEEGLKLGGILLLLGSAAFALRAAVRALRKTPPGRFERALLALARAGIRPRPDQTPREFAGELRGRRPELAALAPLAELHYRERYSGAPLDGDSREQADRFLAELRRALGEKATSPWAR